MIECVIWGGSLAKYRKSIPLADLDLWIITSRGASELETVFLEKLAEMSDILIKAGTNIPWFGRLVTLYSMPDCNFSVDIGIVNKSSMSTISPGPGWAIISPPLGHADKCAIPESFTINKPSTNKSQTERLMEIVSNCIKLRKNLERGFIYNTLEYISRARRELIGLLINDQSHPYERSENKVELYLSPEYLEKLSHTHPNGLDVDSIIKATLNIIQLTLEIPCINQHANIGFSLSRIGESLVSSTITNNHKS